MSEPEIEDRGGRRPGLVAIADTPRVERFDPVRLQRRGQA
jgi:hypothetical protein